MTSLATLRICLVLVTLAPVLAVYLERDWPIFPLCESTEMSQDDVQPQLSYPRILNTSNNDVYIGANGTLRKLSFSESGVTVKDITIDVVPQRDLTIQCEDRGSDFDITIVCWNYIRFVEMTSPEELLVCGTNAANKLCWKCDTDLNDCSKVSGSNGLIGPEIGTEHSATALFIGTDQGDVLYDGARIVTGDSPLYTMYKVDGQMSITRALQTQSLSGQFIDDPTFVGKPFLYYNSDGNNYVFLVYRENAIENQGDVPTEYSRIARVCLNDTGTGDIFNTFIKARLVCSIPEFPFFYYDDIQDMLYDSVSDSVYAVFTTRETGPKASALCRYRMQDINTLFDDGVALGEPANGPYGRCDKTTPPPEQANHLLMKVPVPNYNEFEHVGTADTKALPAALNVTDPPMITMDGVRFTSLTIDRVNGSCVYYFGTSDGTVIKTHKQDCQNSSEEYTTLEFSRLGTSDPITKVAILGDTIKYLVIPTSNNETVIPLTLCSAGSVEECRVRGGPYCTVTNDGDCISVINTGSSVPDDRLCKKQLQIKPQTKEMTVCRYDELVWYCHLDDSNPFVHTTDDVVNWIIPPSGADNDLVQVRNISPNIVELKVTMNDTLEGDYTCRATLADGKELQDAFTLTMTECETMDSLMARCDEHKALEEQCRILGCSDFQNENNQCEVSSATCGSSACP